MALTLEEIAKLTYPFRREDHGFLEGYVYISEEAITERIERVDPDWQFRIQQMIAYGDSVVCIASMTIKGVERSNGGGNPVQRDKQDKDKDNKKLGTYSALPLYTQADNGVNAHKAAVTDALKRCARLFGIGRYLLSAPKEGGTFNSWLDQQHAEAKAALLKLAKTDTTTGEIKPQGDAAGTQDGTPTQAGNGENGVQNPAPKQPSPVTPPTAPISENGGSDKLAQQFPAASKWTPAMLRDRTDTYFNHPAHFDNHWKNHEAEYTGLTLEEAIAYVHQLHWNYDKAQTDKLKAFGVNTLALTSNEILAALTEANRHNVKGWKDWDGGNFTVAQGALLAWKSNYSDDTVTDNAANMGIADGVMFAALDVARQYQRKQAAEGVGAR